MSVTDDELGAAVGDWFGETDIDWPCAPALLTVIEGRATAAEHAAVLAHARTCVQCQASLDEVDETPLIPSQTARAWRPLLWAAAGIAIAIGGALLYRDSPQPEAPTLLAKGGWRLHVAVDRGSRPVRLGADEALRPGDRFGLFYDVDAPGFVVAVYVDAEQRITPLGPPGGHRVDASTGGKLPIGATIGPVSDCEFVVGLYSPELIDSALARDIVEDMLKTASDCQLGPLPESARPIQVDIRRVRP